MKKKRFLLFFMALLFMTSAMNAQEKYAVLLCGDYVNPQTLLWNGDEGWNDTFLMWELLQEKGYSQDNIFVLFADGDDYLPIVYNDRYTPLPGETVTDEECTKVELIKLFNGLGNGAFGYPKVDEDDFLFVWTFLHGGSP